jgi:hypothetical protein
MHFFDLEVFFFSLIFDFYSAIIIIRTVRKSELIAVNQKNSAKSIRGIISPFMFSNIMVFIINLSSIYIYYDLIFLFI